MLPAAFIRYWNHVRRLGPKNTARVLEDRMHKQVFRYQWQRKKLHGGIGHTWEDISRELQCTPTFERFFTQQRARHLPYLASWYAHESRNAVCAHADAYVEQRFDILGSGSQQFDRIAWHTDIRLQAYNPHADCQFDATSFYQDISIITGTTFELVKDIKVPWTLSRFQHAPVLGRAYAATHDVRYAHAFADHVTDWIAHNPYLRGVNWMNPMEVALRAINWVVAFHYFRYAPLHDDFWQQFVCSLYDHLVYLENNWELYDLRTSNHYLADLTGYAYLCWFFGDGKNVQERRVWCHQELLKELDTQVADDGTHYEQATAYHRLVTEMFYHYYNLCPLLGVTMPPHAVKKLSAMVTFIEMCTPRSGSLVYLADNDSGSVLLEGLSDTLTSHIKSTSELSDSVYHFTQGGVSVITPNNWHVTLRHHVYASHQLTSHRHNDAASITLAYKGIPFIVDPGTYVYTPSAVWRNTFRSVQAHSTFALHNEEPIPLDDRIFFVGCEPATMPEQHAGRCMRTTHTQYARHGLRAERNVVYDHSADQIHITDAWHPLDGYEPRERMSCWNFICAPDVKLAGERGCWKLTVGDITLLLMSEQLHFTCHDAWFSPSYGVKVPTLKLCAQLPLMIDAYYCTTLSVI